MNKVGSPAPEILAVADERPAAEVQLKASALPTDVAASELLEQLGHEYFSVTSPPTPGSSDNKHDVPPHRIEPKELAIAAPALSRTRDFWEEVAAMSERSHDWPPSGPGCLRSDPVAHAIATVSASHALATDRRPLPNSANVNSPSLQSGPREVARSPTESSSQSRAAAAAPDFCDVLSSLFGFEQLAGLENVSGLDPWSFTQYRELAASALLAADTNRASALKAAQGRKG